MMHAKKNPLQRVPATLLLVVALMGTMAAQAQRLKTRMADRYSEVFDYGKVASIYEDLSAKGKATPQDLRRLALAYRKLDRSKEAEQTYTKLMATGAQTPDDMLAYADLLRANGNYPVALEWYDNYLSQRPDDARAKAYVSNPGLFDRLMRDSVSAVVRTVPINSPKADLGMSVMNDLLLFSSARGEGVGGTRSYAWDQEPYLNLYSALLKGETAEEPMVMRKELNSRYHDGTVAYDSLAKRLYFTRNNDYYGVLSKNERGELTMGIYFTDVITGEFGQPEWGNLVPFDHNDAQYNLGHPYVTHDGRRLYFVSDRPGGEGGTDIWFCDNLGNQWGVPQNLGPKVNTPGNEMYPYVGRDSTLYFASNGHVGLGGFDIFRSRLTVAGPGTVFNLGYPMNTRYNDHGLLLVNDTTGFFASDRPGGKGSDDVYGCTVRPQMIYLAGLVIDKATRKPVENANIVLKNGQGGFVDRYKLETEPGGRFRMEAEHHQRYLLSAVANGYYQREMTVVTDVDPLENIVIELEKYDYLAEGIVYHGETNEPMADASVVLTDGAGVELARITTDATGRYQFPLQTGQDYRIVVEKEGFFKQSVKVSTQGNPNALIRNDFKLFPLKVNQVVRLDNIFYDYNKWDIRADAAVELDKLLATLMDNPTVRIELSSHTDCRGKDAYNRTLSDKRAKSAVDYIVSKGISRERIIGKGYGESKPVTQCVCEKCSEDEHQQNRRTEFKVLGL